MESPAPHMAHEEQGARGWEYALPFSPEQHITMTPEVENARDAARGTKHRSRNPLRSAARLPLPESGRPPTFYGLSGRCDRATLP